MRTTRRSFIARGLSGAAGTCILGGSWWTNVTAAASDQAIVGMRPAAAELDPSTFDDPGQDRTLRYALTEGR